MNELATQNTSVAVPSGSWGSEEASNKDMVIPRLNLMQDISTLVKGGRARPGQIVNGTSGESLGGVDKKIELIPIMTFAEWLLYDVVDDGRGRTKDKYTGKVVCDKTNENWPQEAVENGKPIRRVRQINVLCLLPTDIDGLPFIVSFKKTGTMAGKKLSTHFQVSAMKGAPAARQVFNLFSSMATFETYSFYRFEVETGRPATPHEVELAYHWYQLFKRGEAKAAEEVVDEQVPF